MSPRSSENLTNNRVTRPGPGSRNRANSATMANQPPRRFPPGGYVVRDANGQALAYIYSRENDAEALQAKVLTKDEARRIAVNIARLPGLLDKAD
jgi:hypothetical protein